MKNLFKGIFHNKKVFITGHTGFQGAWLSLWLNSLGAKVVGYSLEPPTKPSLFDIVNLKEDIINIKGDVSDLQHLYSILKEHKPTFVFHLAAQSLVRLSYEKPIETFQTNVIGTLNILEGIRKIPTIRSCIIMTSDKCYENREWVYAYRENDSLGGSDPYSASKGAAEIITSSYRKSFFENLVQNKKIGIASVRAGNVIGGGDWAKDRIMSDSMRSLLSKKIITVRNPNAVRPWQHVLEPLAGLLWLSARMIENPIKYSGPWNFGPSISNSNVTVKDIVLKTIKQWGGGKWKETKNSKSAHPESNYLRLDSTKAANLLQWYPVYSIEDAISETVSWYKNYGTRHIEMKKFTLEQIHNYSKRAKEMNIVWAN